jgi:hypothetical protein
MKPTTEFVNRIMHLADPTTAVPQRPNEKKHRVVQLKNEAICIARQMSLVLASGEVYTPAIPIPEWDRTAIQSFATTGSYRLQRFAIFCQLIKSISKTPLQTDQDISHSLWFFSVL